MPHFSVIVPSHGVAGRLSQALDSALTQSFADLELVPVCDAPDCAAAPVIAAHAERDARVVAGTHSPASAGLAGARDAGLRVARGTYLLFLDGDDLLVPGALAALDTRARSTGPVDVLYFGHEREPWWTGEPTRPAGPVLAGAPSGAFAPERAPRFTGVSLPAWSAAYRRTFLVETGSHFPDGHFTDIGFGARVAALAGRMAVLDDVVVRHRVRRRGGRPPLSGVEPAALLGRVEEVLRDPATARLSGPRRTALFEQLFTLVLETAVRPHRMPAGDRRGFLREAGALYRGHRPEGYRPPGGALGARFRLLATGSYAAFRTARAANRTLARTVRVLARARALRSRLRYRWLLRRPLDPHLAVYCAYWGRGYTCNPAAVHAKARELAPHIRGVFLVEEGQAHTVPEGVDHAIIGGERYWAVLARAKFLVNNANFAEGVVKRPGSVHLQTQHGTPLKTMGVDQSTYPVVAAATGSFTRLLGRVDRWDYNLSSNPHSTRVWERAFPGSYETLEYGYPRNDVYFAATADDVVRARRELGVPDGALAVLYAPTHRDHRAGFDTGGLDLEAFAASAGEDVVVLLRAHYFHDRGGGRGGGRVVDVTGVRSAERVCLAADALVTDYSSIMFDYANLDRPIVVFADDWEVYRETRGVYFDLPASPPGPVARTPGELTRIFADGSWAGPESSALRSAFRERFCAFDDGRAAERVVRGVFLGEPAEALPPIVPLAERVPAPAASLVRS
ncbi:CDP-glycerol glycerophosphotransferase family protein [Streptomyces sp. ZYX-F-203]